VLLPHKAGEIPGPPLAGKDLVAHRSNRISGEPDPRHSQRPAVAASFRTWPGSPNCNAGRPAGF